MPRRNDHYYLTTPIYYVNAAAHIGHAYSSIAADVMARFQRLLGRQVNFLTGTDEHGQKIARAAEAAGKGPQTFVDEIAQNFRDLNGALTISNTDFIRTTEPRHILGAQKFWEAARAAGDIYKKEYEGLYCVACEQFYIPKDLADGLCPVHACAPELLKEENYFFCLSKYSDQLKKHFDAHPTFVYPRGRWNEMRTLLDEGLTDISISRSREKLTWGIPVPDDDTQVIYVWFDALTNYITAIGYGADEHFFNTWWPANAHVMAKEINRFHSLLWPAMLMSAGQLLPEKIIVHGWLTVDGKKISKTTGNVIDPFNEARVWGADAFRYFLMRELSFGADGDFSEEKLRARYTSDLQHDLGNLLMRTIAMTHKYCDGVVPSATTGDYQELWTRYRAHMEAWEFQQALECVGEKIRALNQYIDHEKPWVLMKAGERARTDAVLYTVLEGLRHIMLALLPFIPSAADRALAQLGFEFFEPNFDRLTEWGLLKSGTPVTAGDALFPPVA